MYDAFSLLSGGTFFAASMMRPYSKIMVRTCLTLIDVKLGRSEIKQKKEVILKMDIFWPKKGCGLTLYVWFFFIYMLYTAGTLLCLHFLFLQLYTINLEIGWFMG